VPSPFIRYCPQFLSAGITAMSTTENTTFRYFTSYSGITLPLKLLNELEESEINNRNTYFRATYDAQGRMVLCQKLVYGETELEHRYRYFDNGMLREALIIMDGDEQVIGFDEQGNRT
jgi:hypothetical protein